MESGTLAQHLLTWRHELHRHPETAFQEVWTGDFISAQLEKMGISVTRNVGGTGLVGTLTCGSGEGTIGLRADMDANSVGEEGNPEWKSQNPGVMHSCGHDGHVAQLLGAAEILAKKKNFNGTVYFVFQPAEEPGKGAKAMLADGLLKRFPMQEIYGMHNMPNISTGKVHVRSGGIMGSEDNFTIQVHGKGAHASSPHMSIDPLVTASEVIIALQTIVSRTVNPIDPIVISCTELYMDGAHNLIPSNVTIKGDVRSYSPSVQALAESRMRAVSEHICSLNGADCEFSYTHEFAPMVNHKEQVAYVAEAAAQIVGKDNVDADCLPVMISEDFAHYLEQIPGAFFFLGSGDADRATDNIMLHNPKFDYNDKILTNGAEILAKIASLRLQ